MSLDTLPTQIDEAIDVILKAFSVRDIMNEKLKTKKIKMDTYTETIPIAMALDWNVIGMGQGDTFFQKLASDVQETAGDEWQDSLVALSIKDDCFVVTLCKIVETGKFIISGLSGGIKGHLIT